MSDHIEETCSCTLIECKYTYVGCSEEVSSSFLQFNIFKSAKKNIQCIEKNRLLIRMIKDDNISKMRKKRERERKRTQKLIISCCIIFSSQNQSSTLPIFVKKHDFGKHSFAST